MSFITSSLLYSYLGLVIGFLTHLFYGIVQSSIVFNRRYIVRLIHSFLKLALVFLMVNLALLPFSQIIGHDEFTRQLVYYIMSFAAFDFTFHVVKANAGVVKKLS